MPSIESACAALPQSIRCDCGITFQPSVEFPGSSCRYCLGLKPEQVKSLRQQVDEVIERDRGIARTPLDDLPTLAELRDKAPDRVVKKHQALMSETAKAVADKGLAWVYADGDLTQEPIK